jgi:hypothetical protein
MLSSQYSILVIVIRVDPIVFNSKRDGVCGTGFWRSGTGRREGGRKGSSWWMEAVRIHGA